MGQLVNYKQINFGYKKIKNYQKILKYSLNFKYYLLEY